MRDQTEWWGDVQMRSHVTPGIVIAAIAGAVGSKNQERWFPFEEVVGIDQLGPGGDESSFVTRLYVGCVHQDAMDEMGVMETVLKAIAPLVNPAWSEFVYELSPGYFGEGYVYRFVADGIERTDAIFAPVEPRRWKGVD